MYKSVNSCSSCEGELKELAKFSMPLVGNFLDEGSVAEEYPLTICACDDCDLVQIKERPEPEELFGKYFYKTGAIPSLAKHFVSLSKVLKSKFDCSKVLELGCNDFSLLQNFEGTKVGVDPSDVALKYKPDDAYLFNDFFSYDNSLKIKESHGEFPLIVSCNNFAHIDEIKDSASGVHNLLSPEGVFVVEVHSLKSLVDNFQVGFIYHEHIYYYTVKSFEKLMNSCGLYINELELIGTHGGSYRFFCSKYDYQSANVVDQKRIESKINFRSFLDDVQNVGDKLNEYIANQSGRVIGYGASGQASSMISLFKLPKDSLEFIIDDSPLKIGKLTPTGIPIKAKENIKEGDNIVVFAYTFINDIRDRLDGLGIKSVNLIHPITLEEC